RRINLLTDKVDGSRDLVTGDEWRARRVGIDPQAAHDVREIDAHRLHANPHFAGLRMRQRLLLHVHHIRLARLCDPDLSHPSLLERKPRNLTVTSIAATGGSSQTRALDPALPAR